MSESVEWARKLQRQLQAEIRKAETRPQTGESRAEQLGLLRASDRLPSLRNRLAQLDRLIEAVDETAPLESGWPAFLGDPSATLPDSATHKAG